MHKEKKKKEFTLHFLMLYFSLSEGLEQVITCYIAVLSYLGCRVTSTSQRLDALEDPLNKYTLSITQPKSIFLGSCSRHVLRVECKAWFEIGDRILDQTLNSIGKIT